MAVETKAKVGLFPSDEVTQDFVTARGRGGIYKLSYPDAEAIYEQVIPVDINGPEPMLSYPHAVDKVFPVGKAKEIRFP